MKRRVTQTLTWVQVQRWMLREKDGREAAASIAIGTAADFQPSESQPISCPLVLQCRNCRAIVGDTCSIVDLNPNLMTITLQSTMGENVIIDEELHTSKEGIDFGSTFHMITCRQCQTALGRMYRTTSSDLDIWRGFYTFSSDVLSFYELSAEVSSLVAIPQETIATEDLTQCKQVNGIAPSGDNSIEISKLQKFCVYLYDRIGRLEEELKLLKENKSKNANRDNVDHEYSTGHDHSNLDHDMVRPHRTENNIHSRV